MIPQVHANTEININDSCNACCWCFRRPRQVEEITHEAASRSPDSSSSESIEIVYTRRHRSKSHSSNETPQLNKI